MVQSLQAAIDEHEYKGWKVVERKPTLVVMQKRSFGSLWLHIPLLVTLGIGNVIYAAWRYLRPKEKVIKGQPMEAQGDLNRQRLEAQKERNRQRREAGKNAREASRLFRKFF